MSDDYDPDYDLSAWTREQHMAEAFRLMNGCPETGSDERDYAYEAVRTENQLQAICHLLCVLVGPVGVTNQPAGRPHGLPSWAVCGRCIPDQPAEPEATDE